MKINKMYWLLVVLTGLIAAKASFAQYPDKLSIARKCHEVAYQLKHLADDNRQNACAGDVSIAAAYIDATEMKLRHARFNEALVSIHYGTSELKEIAYSRPYCVHFSSFIKPYIARTIEINAEIDVLERMRLKLPS
jgi:hypothetical protein